MFFYLPHPLIDTASLTTSAMRASVYVTQVNMNIIIYTHLYINSIALDHPYDNDLSLLLLVIVTDWNASKIHYKGVC